ncbi:MAG TPA: hypothetical protein VF228_00590 [Iamia sp.]
MSPDRSSPLTARRRGQLLAAALGVVVIVVAVIVVTGGGDDGDDPSEGDSTTTASAPPSEVEFELVDVDLAQPTAPADALGSGDLTVALVPGTVRAEGDDLVALADDREAMAPEPIIPLVSLDVAFPELETMFQDISDALTTDALADLVAFSGADEGMVEDVVSSWLGSNDLAAPTPIEAPGPMRIQTLADPDLQVAALVYGEVLLAAGFEIEYLEPVPAASDLVGAVGARSADLVLAGGSSLLVALGGPATPLTPADELRSAITARAEETAATALVPAAADRALRMLTAPATAEELDLETMSDLGRVTGLRSIGATAGCGEDPLCRPLLESAYGLRFAS